MINENNLFENNLDTQGAPDTGVPASSHINMYYKPQPPYSPPPPLPKIPRGMDEQTYNEKKSAKKCARIAGAGFVAFKVLSQAISYLYIGVMLICGFSLSHAIEYVSDGIFSLVYQIVAATLLFTVPFIVVACISKLNIGQELPFCRPKKGTAIPFFFVGIGFCAFANIATSVAGNFFYSFGIDHPNIDMDTPGGIIGITLSCIATIAIPALVEEFACRGIVFAALKPQGEGVAIFVSALLFGLMHGNFIQIPFAFLVGLVLGFVRVKTNTLWVCCAIHAANNAVSVFFDYTFTANPELRNIIYIFYLVICMMLGIIGVVMLANNNSGDDFFKLDKGEYKTSSITRTKWVILSPFIIVFTAITAMDALSRFLE